MGETELTEAWRNISEIADILHAQVGQIADRKMFPRALALRFANLTDANVNKNETSTEIMSSVLKQAGFHLRRGDIYEFAEHGVNLARRIELSASNQQVPPSGEVSESGIVHSGSSTAKTKLEAVNRISALTRSGPQTLGPGSKERKSVLENLWRGSFDEEPPLLDKAALAREIIKKFGGTPEDKDSSTGYTITLYGLNKILRLATLYLQRTGQTLSPTEEAELYLGVIAESLGAKSHDRIFAPQWIEGRSAVEEMHAKRYSQVNQTEWFGWYLEFKSLPLLKRTYPGTGRRFGNTTFDFKGIRYWDLKAHASHYTSILLNDQRAIDMVVADGGLGFIVVSHDVNMDDWEKFDDWHRAFRARNTHRPVSVRRPKSRKLKPRVLPTKIEAFFIQDIEHLRKYVDEGSLVVWEQGRQASGAERREKYKLDLKVARKSQMLIAQLPYY